jgi:superoxide dismutase, Fe-Mn family
MTITPKTFTIPAVAGLSEQSIGEHIKLYEGYVKHFNLIQEKLAEYSADVTKYAYEIGELSRRTSFEYNGIRNHEYYFEQLQGGPLVLDPVSDLGQKIATQWGSVEEWVTAFKQLAKTRGIGWAILYYDMERDMLVHTWSDEQHLGHLGSCQFIFGIDMWEHSYVFDYQPSGKGKYIDDYMAAVNWDTVAKRFTR